MKFLVDAQLPRCVCDWLRENGHDALHTLDLVLGNRTSDAEITRLADAQGRVVVTKDDDFVQSFVVMNRPRRLLLIATGNIANVELKRLLAAALPAVVEAYNTANYVEIGRDSIIVHE